MSIPLVLTRRGWALLLWAAAVWGSWWVIGLRDMWYLPAFLGGLVVAGGIAVLVLPTIAGLKVEVSVAEAPPRVGESTAVSIRMRQRLGLRFRCVAEIDVAGEISRKRVELIGRQTGFRWLWDPPQRGRCSLGVRRVEVQDPLGLVVRRMGSAQMMRQLVVLPARYEDTPELFEAAGGIGSTGQQGSAYGGSAGSGSPSGAVRDYRTGDALRQIHWKQSARQGKLLTNVPEIHRPEADISVLLITSPREYSDDEEFERAVSATATLVERWAQRGYRVRLMAGAQAPVISASEAELLSRLAVVDTDPAVQADQLLPAEEHAAVVVTGILTGALAEQLKNSGNGGAVLTAGHNDHVGTPPRWRLLALPAQSSETTGAGRLSGSYL